MSEQYKDIKNVPKLVDIMKMDADQARDILTAVKQNHTNKVMQNHFNVSSGKLYSIFNKLNVPYDKKGNIPKGYNITKAELQVMRDSVRTWRDIVTNVKSKEEFNKLVDEYRIKFTKTALLFYWGITRKAYDDFIESLPDFEENIIEVQEIGDLPEMKIEDEEINNEGNNKVNADYSKIVDYIIDTIKNSITVDETYVDQQKFSISINDTLEKDEIVNKLRGLTEILSPDKKYDIKINISEK